MSDTILITASIRIDAPVDRVRAQYGDIDHHIRRNVHPDIQYEWQPGAPGERKIKTTFRILGVAQFDVSLLEDATDGSLVIRYLEGTNAGMILVHEFVPVDGGTDVRLSANAPATLGRKLLGPFFKVGARQVMNKALREDKADIEGGAHVPGAAAGNLERALAALALPEPVRASAAVAILSAACLITAADAEVDEAELDVLREIAKKVNFTLSSIRPLLEAVSQAEASGLAAKAAAMGKDLAREGVVEQGLAAAVVAALVSHGMALGELEALRALAAAAGYPEENLGPLVERIDAALMFD